MLIEIKNNIIKDLKEYCKLNSIEDWEGMLNKLLLKGLMISKYGTSPVNNKKIEDEGTKDFTNNIIEKEDKPKNDKKPRRTKKTEEDKSSNVTEKREEEKELLPQEEAKPVIKKTRIIRKIKST